MTPELLQKVIQDSFRLSLSINAKDVRESIDPLKFIESHKARGGPSPKEVKRMLKVRKQWTTLSQSNLLKKKLELDESNDQLQSLTQSYSSSNNASIIKLKNANR